MGLQADFASYVAKCEGETILKECEAIEKEWHDFALPEFAKLCYAQWNCQKAAFRNTQVLNATPFDSAAFGDDSDPNTVTD